LAVSRDGTVTVGSATNDQGSVAVSWTVGADGNVTTTVLSSSEAPSEAAATSRDGKVVVGYDGGATRWTEGRSDKIADLLGQAGVALDGWLLRVARGVSDDGRVIVGEGINGQGTPEGWVAVLPP